MFETDATNLPRVMNCNGSRLMGGFSSPMTTNSNEERDKGNAAHWLLEKCFGNKNKCFDLINTKANNGFFITDEIAEHVSDILDVFHARPGKVEYESFFGNDYFRVSCRADHVSFHDGTLYIDEFKYGWRIVEPENNWTLIAHAIGYCIQNNVSPQRICFTIFQPRPDHHLGRIRTWEIDGLQLHDLWSQVFNTLSNLNEQLNTGSHCAKCPALATCHAAKMAGMNSIEASAIAHDENIDNNVLAFELDTLNRAKTALNSRLEALEELAKHRIMQGQIVENYSVERGLGNTTWKKGITPEMVKALTGVNVVSGKMITPNQAMKKHADETAVKSLTYRPETGMKLKRINADKKAQKFFNKPR